MDPEVPKPKKKKIPPSSIWAVSISTLVFMVLLGIMYYFSVAPIPQSQLVPTDNFTAKKTEDVKEEPKPITINPTTVIKFTPTETLPTETKNGNCFSSSASALRQDAWRCSVENSIYDPCFSLSQKPGYVFCQQDPLAGQPFIVKLTKSLPKVLPQKNQQDNWAWFLVLRDGTQCSPFTGTRPLFGTPPDIQAAYYGCKTEGEKEQIVLLGDLVKGEVWTANAATISENRKDIKNTSIVQIETVWQ